MLFLGFVAHKTNKSLDIPDSISGIQASTTFGDGTFGEGQNERVFVKRENQLADFLPYLLHSLNDIISNA